MSAVIEIPELVIPGEIVDEQPRNAENHSLARIIPVRSIEDAIASYEHFQEMVSRLLVIDEDYGRIPGTKDHTLFKPGAEKLCDFFGLRVNPMLQDHKEVWDDPPFFFARYRSDVIRLFDGKIIATAERSCNSKEKKWRYVWVKAPKPFDDEIIEQKKEEGTGRFGKDKQGRWLWLERRDHPNPWDLANVMTAMAQKRSGVAGVMIALNASGFFSRTIEADDAEDLYEKVGGGEEGDEPRRGGRQTRQTQTRHVSPEEKELNDELLRKSIEKKGEKNGAAYFEQVILPKSLEDKKAMLGRPAVEADPPKTETSQPPQGAMVNRQKLFNIIDSLVRANVPMLEIEQWLGQRANGVSSVINLDEQTAANLICPMMTWLQDVKPA